MRVKIYSCHHAQPEFIFSTPLFQTMVSGVAMPSDSRVETDLIGDNINADNDFSELRHQYFVWKNKATQFDIVGFEHYRRPFLIDLFESHELDNRHKFLFGLRRRYNSSPVWALVIDDNDMLEYMKLRSNLSEEQDERIQRWLGSYDIVVNTGVSERIDEQWQNTGHDAALWNVIVDLTRASPYFEKRQCVIDFSLSRVFYRNMYIMRSDLYSEYMEFCFGILFKMRDELKIRSHRLYGYVSERLFNFWIYQKKIDTPALRVLELPVLLAKSSLPK